MNKRFEAFDELERDIILRALSDLNCNGWTAIEKRVATMKSELLPTFDVILHKTGEQKIAVIKEIRASVPGLGLSDAKALTEHDVPVTIAKGTLEGQARDIAKRLAAVGATAEALQN